MITKILTKAKNAYLTSPVRPFLRQTKIEGILQSVYRRAIHALSDDTSRLTVAGVTAEFDSTHPDDARLLSRDIERPVQEDLLNEMTEDDVFYDIGGHIGTYAFLSALKTSPSNVFAFEPSPNNIKRFKRNLSLNNLDVNLFQIALSDFSGQASFLEARDTMQKSQATGKITEGDSSERNNISVDVERGDDFIQQEGLPTPTIVKVDVEGAEVGVVRGLVDTLSRSECRLFYCEVHPEEINQFGDTTEELMEQLEDCGFEVERFHEAFDGRYFIKANR